MPDVLIRGLSARAVARLDADAEALGLSRNEYLRRKFEAPNQADESGPVTVADLQRAANAVNDLLDPDVMDSAWR